MALRPRRRAFTVGLIGVLLVLAGATAQAAWLFVLSSGVFALLAASLLVPHRLGAVEVERAAPRRARVGDLVRVGLRVTNARRRGIPAFRLEDAFPAFARIAVISERLGPGATGELETVRRAQRRGVFSSGPVVLHGGAPFGFLRSRRTIDVPTETTVVPRWVDLTSFPILEPSSFPSDVLHERARTGAGEQYLGVRDYRPGDPRRSVHWRSSARAGHLVVREFEEEVLSPVALILSAQDHGERPDSSFEHLVSATASIALYSLVTGHPVDLLRPSVTGGIEELGRPGREEVLEWLAGAEAVPGDLGPLVARAAQRVARRGTVVVLASSLGVGPGLPHALRSIQAAGSRAIAVVARSSTWLDGAEEARRLEQDLLPRLGSGRSGLRVIARGEALETCLQA